VQAPLLRVHACLVADEDPGLQIANSRWVLLMLWMSKCGPGLVAAQDVINAARRLRIT
jgi:hypothetical protein